MSKERLLYVVLLWALVLTASGFEWRLTPGFVYPIGNSRFCRAFRVPENGSFYMTGATLENYMPENHYVVSRCRKPGVWDPEKPDQVWDCYGKTGDFCDGDSTTMMGMQFSHPHPGGIHFVPGTGYELGRDADFTFVVITTHERIKKQVERDNSTVVLFLTKKEPGVEIEPLYMISLNAYTVVPPHESRTIESFYEVHQNVTLRPTQFIMHTHKGPSSGQMWIVDEDGVWYLMGEELSNGDIDRRLIPQTLLEHGRLIRQGDRIVVRCVVPNNGDTPMLVRESSDKQEMCQANFIYTTVGDSAPLDIGTSINDGSRTWADDPLLARFHGKNPTV